MDPVKLLAITLSIIIPQAVMVKYITALKDTFHPWSLDYVFFRMSHPLVFHFQKHGSKSDI